MTIMNAIRRMHMGALALGLGFALAANCLARTWRLVRVKSSLGMTSPRSTRAPADRSQTTTGSAIKFAFEMTKIAQMNRRRPLQVEIETIFQDIGLSIR